MSVLAEGTGSPFPGDERLDARGFRALVEHALELMLVWDGDGSIIYASPATVRFARGDTSIDAANKTVASTAVTIHPDDRQAVLRMVAGLAGRPGASAHFVARYFRYDGVYRSLSVTVTNQLHDPAIRGMISHSRDITDQLGSDEAVRQGHEQLRRQARDARELQRSEAFLDAIVEQLPDMVFVKDAEDLRFVRLNWKAEDILGYSRDELLGKNDYDFFPVEQADFFTARDREVLAARTVIEIEAEPIDTAHGRRVLHTKKIPIYDRDGQPQYLLGIAEDVTEQHTAELERAQQRQQCVARIEQTLADGDITMVFQPIVELSTGHAVGVEALARFPAEPQRPPDEWFAEASAVGLGTDLELLAVRCALRDLDNIDPTMYLSVNISPQTLRAPDFYRIVGEAAPERLVIEITEHAAVDDYGFVRQALARLQDLGVRVAVDDAGSGFASLRHILNIQPDIIKLDIELTRGVDTDPARRALASALVGFGREINAVIVAEGIETQTELDALRGVGIRYGQGFHIARPTPIPLLDAMTTSLRASAAG